MKRENEEYNEEAQYTHYFHLSLWTAVLAKYTHSAMRIDRVLMMGSFTLQFFSNLLIYCVYESTEELVFIKCNK